jgi:hypothetical protein
VHEVAQKAHTGVTTGKAESHRPSLREWFTAYFELSSVNQLVATVVSTMRKPHRRQLGACIGAPGPHDFAVRDDAVRRPAPLASTATRFTFVTTRTPLVSKRDA